MTKYYILLDINFFLLYCYLLEVFLTNKMIVLIHLIMKTYLLDIIYKIQNFSDKLDNLALLTNQHWVSIDEQNSQKTIYIFRPNNQLLISINGVVKKEKWDYLGNKTILLDTKEGCYMLKQGFFDENILALKVDSTNKYVIFVNENKFDGELNTIQNVHSFLNNKYLSILPNSVSKCFYKSFYTNKGLIKIGLLYENAAPCIGNLVSNDDMPVPDGKYRLGFMNYIIIKGGIITDLSVL